MEDRSKRIEAAGQLESTAFPLPLRNPRHLWRFSIAPRIAPRASEKEAKSVQRGLSRQVRKEQISLCLQGIPRLSKMGKKNLNLVVLFKSHENHIQ